MLSYFPRVTKRIVKKIATSSSILKKNTLQKWVSEKRVIPPVTERNLENYILQVVQTKSNFQRVGANWLINHSRNSASEHGEDGIISKIFEILKPENKWVCEFGAHDPEIISNTWHLIHKNNWKAVLIEADDICFEKLDKYYQKSNTVHCLKSKVSYEGNEKLDNLLKATPIPENLDFMIIDIDGNDYHVWEAIEKYLAKVVMIEFNASFHVDISYIQPRDQSLNRGASLNAMVELAKRKGYKLIAVTSWNAFFVQEQYYSLFFNEEPKLKDMYVYPAKHPIWMRAFQLYDGTILIAPWNEMLWHKVDLISNDYQVLPTSYRFFSRELASHDYVIEKTGKMTSLQEENLQLLNKIFQMPANVLSAYAHNVYSRYGEDGIIEKLISLVSAEHLYFVEVGSWDGITHSRSRNLAENHSWNGLLLENDPAVRALLVKNYKGFPKVKVIRSNYSLDDENSLDAILKRNHIPKELELLILSCYGMEYYLWEQLRHYSPKIIAVQFNPTIPNDVCFVQANNFSIHQGCSLKALCDLATYKGYELVCVTMETAFFINRKYIYRLFEKTAFNLASSLDEMFSPIQMQLSQLYDGTIHLEGLNRLLWHGIRFDVEKLQIIPQALRVFHQHANVKHKKFFYRID